jgi:hypothetical protein
MREMSRKQVFCFVDYLYIYIYISFLVFSHITILIAKLGIIKLRLIVQVFIVLWNRVSFLLYYFIMLY